MKEKAFMMTLLLLVLIFVLFNFNFDIFNAGAAPASVYGEGTPGYIAKWIGVSLPTASNVTFTEPDYCNSPGGTLGWTYSGFSIPQDGFRIQIDNKANFSDCPGANCEFDDTCRLSLGCTKGGDESYNLSVLPWNRPALYARVMVWNTSGMASSWEVMSFCNNHPSSKRCNGNNSWQTPPHVYPDVDPPSGVAGCTTTGYDFSWSPCRPGVGSEISFTDHTNFDDANSSGQAWRWIFGDGTPNCQGNAAACQNPKHTYTIEGIYNVTEGVLDDATNGNYCQVTKAINIQKPIPKWREVAPR